MVLKQYKEASALIEKNQLEFDVRRSQLRGEDALLYFLYGGNAFAGLRRFDEATSFYFAAVTLRADVASAIAIDAYKRYVLTSFLWRRSTGALPRALVSAAVERAVQSLKPYEELVAALRALKLGDIQRVLETHIEAFEADSNVGLVRQCAEAAQRQIIKNHTRTYINMSFEKLRTSIGAENNDQLESLLLKMVKREFKKKMYNINN